MATLQYNPAAWYFTVAGHPNQVYSSAAAGFVSTTDAGYLAWVAAGGQPTAVSSLGALTVRLAAQYPAGAPRPTRLSPIQFIDLFTRSEEAVIFSAAYSQADGNPALAIWLARMLATPVISLSAQSVIAGVNGLVAANLLTAARAADVLAGQAPPAS